MSECAPVRSRLSTRRPHFALAGLKGTSSATPVRRFLTARLSAIYKSRIATLLKTDRRQTVSVQAGHFTFKAPGPNTFKTADSFATRPATKAAPFDCMASMTGSFRLPIVCSQAIDATSDAAERCISTVELVRFASIQTLSVTPRDLAEELQSASSTFLHARSRSTNQIPLVPEQLQSAIRCRMRSATASFGKIARRDC